MTREPATAGFLGRILLASLSVGPVGCFIVGGVGPAKSTEAHPRPGGRFGHRPLQQRVGIICSGALTEAHLCGEAADGMWSGFCGESRTSGRCRAAGMAYVRQEVRLFASAGGARDRVMSEQEVEKGYTPEEREFVENFFAEYDRAQEPEQDDDELAVYAHDYKMYADDEPSLNIEWDAAMGKFDAWDLPPMEEFDPQVPPVHYKYSSEELQAQLTSEVNPFPLHSEWVDRDIKVGDIDEAKKKAIEPMMPVIEQVCELIDTTDDVFSFKYVGPIRHKKGIAAWARVLIERLYPEVKGVELVTNRTRDLMDR